jgi:hypothetical protein
MTEICMTSSTSEMHMVRSKADVRRTSILNRRSVKKGIMTITVPIMTNLIDTILSKGGGCNAGGVKAFSQDLKRVR